MCRRKYAQEYAIENMDEICKNMKNYRAENMQKYACICRFINMHYMKNIYAVICIICKYMQVYAIKYMQNYAFQNMSTICKNMQKHALTPRVSILWKKNAKNMQEI